MKVFRNVKRAELVTIPVLVTCVIPSAFKCVEDVKMENAENTLTRPFHYTRFYQTPVGPITA